MNILAESAYDQMQENFAQDIWHDIEHTGMSLAELARSQDGLFQVLSDMTHYYLDEETWLKLQNTPLNAIDHDLTDPIGDALGRAMSLYRDRHVMLKAVDTLWVRHLTELDGLREGIGLRAYGQQDPLISYKKEAYEMYEGLLAGIEHDIVYQLLHVGLKVQQPRRVQEVRTNRTDGGKPQRAAPASHGRPVGKVGRNDLCPCGSGKKFKHCHGSGLPASAGGARPGDGRQMLPQAQPSGKVPAGQAERKDAKNTGKKR